MTNLCSPSTMWGPFCSVPAVPIITVVVPAWTMSRTSAQVKSSRNTVSGAVPPGPVGGSPSGRCVRPKRPGDGVNPSTKNTRRHVSRAGFFKGTSESVENVPIVGDISAKRGGKCAILRCIVFTNRDSAVRLVSPKTPMTTARWTVVCTALCAAIFVAAGGHLVAGRSDVPTTVEGLDLTMSAHAQRQAAPRTAPPTQVKAKESPDEIIQSYCVDCHNDVTKPGGLSFETFQISTTANEAPTAERMIRKLRAGMMPPPGTDPPDAVSLAGLVTALETRLDAAAALKPNPGSRIFPRLNRVEYARSIKELLDLDVDAGQWLPLDSMSANFDNIADEQMLSATLLESFLNAASDISRMAVGH